jgi:ABC-type uncharacterized transport system substrate-binding protein
MLQAVTYLTLAIILLISSVLTYPGNLNASSSTNPVATSASSKTDSSRLKKVLYVNSYHWGYEWSDFITRSISDFFGARVNSKGEIDNSNSLVFLKVFYMDTKRNDSLEYIEHTSNQVRILVDEWQPDVVITSDDNAAKYLIVPFYKDSSLPFVFCGINWDSSDYGLPCSNVTGMIEVQIIDQLIHVMRNYADGDRIAFLKGDDLSTRKEALQYEQHFNIALDKRFIKTFAQWKEQYIQLQSSADMILLGNPSSISGWDAKEAKAVIAEYTTIPTGNWDAWMAPLALITFATKPQEQGEWAAAAAMSILAGTSPSDIPVVQNKTAKVLLNMRLAKKLGIKFPMELINRATFTGE